jgi:hypothetical protein
MTLTHVRNVASFGTQMEATWEQLEKLVGDVLMSGALYIWLISPLCTKIPSSSARKKGQRKSAGLKNVAPIRSKDGTCAQSLNGVTPALTCY